MEQRLNQEQLKRVVAEVEELSRRQQDELSPDQVREILRELNLPPELLEDALVQVQRRDALQAQQKRNRWIYAGIGTAIAVVLIGSALWLIPTRTSLSKVAAQQDRITLTEDNGGNLDTVTRQANPALVYRVTLMEAPIGQKLSLNCDWFDPSGQIVHQNRYETKSITTPVWNTACRYTLGTAAPTGTWKVQMRLDKQVLSDAIFEVK